MDDPTLPDGPGLFLSEPEAQVVGLLVARLAKIEREDIIGAILKNGGHVLLGSDDGGVVNLANKLEKAFKRSGRNL